MARQVPALIALFILVIPMTGDSASLSAKVTGHFDGERFSNGPNESASEGYRFSERVKWMWSTKLVEWPDWITDPVYPPPPGEVGKGGLRVTHINHATMLIQLDGVNILTDPIWSARASFVSWAGPRRVRAPGLKMEDLPRIDLILISHDHYDHLDLASLVRLTRQHQPKVVVGLGVGKLLASAGIARVTELDWWQTMADLPNGLKVVFVPARHGSGRGMGDRNKTLWGGYVMESTAGNVYFAGDTAYGHFRVDLKKRFGGFRLAMLPIGHYEPRWMMQSVHMSPDDAVKLHRDLNIRQSVGMHFGTFHGMGAHNNEKVDQHETDLRQALREHAVPETEFWLLGFGEGRDVAGHK